MLGLNPPQEAVQHLNNVAKDGIAPVKQVRAGWRQLALFQEPEDLRRGAVVVKLCARPCERAKGVEGQRGLVVGAS